MFDSLPFTLPNPVYLLALQFRELTLSQEVGSDLSYSIIASYPCVWSMPTCARKSLVDDFCEIS